jgi:hypothetical protein
MSFLRKMGLSGVTFIYLFLLERRDSQPKEREDPVKEQHVFTLV